MSRVSVTGTKAVMGDVIEAIHELHLVHFEGYDGSWEGFTQGDPLEPAEELSQDLVTVRSIESILDVDDTTATLEDLDEDLRMRIEEIRTDVTELDDRRSELRDELRTVDETIDTIAPFVDLGIDLDLLSGYRSIEVRVGEGDLESVRSAVSQLDGPSEVFASDGTVAVAAAVPAETLDDVLVGSVFSSIEIPDATGDPHSYVSELESRRERLEANLETLVSELNELKLDVGGFLMAAEERMSIEVQKAEIPLRFATSKNAFIAEGWLPTDSFPELESAVTEAVGDRAEVEELERADYDPPAHHDEIETVADGGAEMRIGGAEPPVIQSNPAPMKPFELLVETINRPQYWSFDPTVVLFLTFPLFFGFMIGDVGYGILYFAIGYWLWSRFSSTAIRALGGIAMWAGVFTIIFGVLYGELFGLHTITTYLWEPVFGLHSAPMHKGLQPADTYYAQAWLILVMVAGIVHVGLGYIIGFIEDLRSHGLKDAIYEDASWLLLLLGVWVWIFSVHGRSQKPEFIYTVFDGGESAAYALGFSGLPEAVGIGALGVAVLGLILLLVGEGGTGLLESLNVLVNILSYARIAAVLLAKAGMAFVVNLLVFGVYEEHGEFHFLFFSDYSAAEVIASSEYTLLFPGLINGSGPLELVIGGIAGLLVLVLGHLLVLGLGITSAGLQAVRLEYVEFFSKFYYGDAGGKPYEPFGYTREYTR